MLSGTIKNSNKLLQQKFDYIIAGAGCAGLSLLMRMMQNPFFDNKKILVIDKQQKNKNDRTWCFWEKDADIFEPIVYHRWPQLNFYSNTFSSSLHITPYQYKMIRGIDFYNHVLQCASSKKNIVFLYDDVKKLYSENNKGFAETSSGIFSAEYVFSSLLNDDFSFMLKKENNQKPKGIYTLLQHFKGWVIETDTDVFDANAATFMDFRVPQQYGTTFVYVLPVSPRKALVEYTLFNEEILPHEKYDEALRDYIKNYLNINSYAITEEEYGIIPMSNFCFKEQNENVINLGMAGGQTKASSGFTFKFIQKQTRNIIEQLQQQQPLHLSATFAKKKFDFYDSVLLHVLHYDKMNGDEIFSRIFKKNKPQLVLRFLDNETTIGEDVKILSSLPSSIFFPAGVKEIKKKMF